MQNIYQLERVRARESMRERELQRKRMRVSEKETDRIREMEKGNIFESGKVYIYL